MPRRGAPYVWEASRSPIFRSDRRAPSLPKACRIRVPHPTEFWRLALRGIAHSNTQSASLCRRHQIILKQSCRFAPGRQLLAPSSGHHIVGSNLSRDCCSFLSYMHAPKFGEKKSDRC